MLIAGPGGIGKSLLAQPWGMPPRQCYDVLFITETQLMASLHTAQAMGTYEWSVYYLNKVSLLIIDDFGLKPLRAPEDEDFNELIAERYEKTDTMLTSNLHFDEWGAAFAANKMIGAATLDRLRHGPYKRVLDGERYRAPPPESEGSNPPLEKRKKAEINDVLLII